MSSVTTLAVQIAASRYLVAVGYVVLLWDTLLILPDEIERVWRGGISVTKLAYLLNHYVSIVFLTVLTHAFSGLTDHTPSKSFCVNASTLGLAGGVVSLGIGNYLVMLQVWQLWEQRSGIRLLLTVGWAVSYTITLTFACLVIVDLYPLMNPVPGFNICALTRIPGLIRFMWASPIVYEVLVFGFTVFNAFDRPRPADVGLAGALYRDGVLYFVSLFILRVINLVVTSLSPTPFVHVGSTLIWSSNVVALNRLILNQRVSIPESDERGVDLEMFDTCTGFVRVHSTALSFDDTTLKGLDFQKHKRSLSPSSDITLRDMSY
ncbi:hypothetical protein EXIGLDRAFT_324274 [Exidia glandulosa HHB12029]|uniref:DUF6533 domain-containing protein n=1 Tax=Exidia glandulosa HHB12029 TaxID=1314781 RepID=A0A165CUG9_EXIGL|nr:hypothetical protein EXIGLDRAFT_324274 [Exidia glandulosa HHB12029]